MVIKYINRLDAHHKLYISLFGAVIVLISLYGKFSTPVYVMVTWLAYCMISLTLSWITILSSHPAEVKHEVHAQDSSRTAIFLFAVAASFVSLFAILILLKGSSESSSPTDLTVHILLSLTSVICSWALVHEYGVEIEPPSELQTEPLCRDIISSVTKLKTKLGFVA